MSTNDHAGWGAYERLVLAKLEELSEDIKEIQSTQARQNVEIAMLRVKSGLWGATAGLIPFGLWIAYALLGGGN